MSLFRTPSFRLKKREKAHRPRPLEETPERKEQEAETMDAPGSSFLVVPDTARSTFFTLPSGMSSRSSLFGRNSTSSQDEKKSSSLFKLPNLSRSSFVLKRDREDRKGSRSDEFARGSGDADNCGYVPKSKRSESASNLLELLVRTERTAPPTNSNVRQRSQDPSSPTSPILDEPTITARMSLHSPSPTIVSTMSTIQDSLLGDYSIGNSSSESDHDQSFAPGEDKCSSVHECNSFAAVDEASTDSKKSVDASDRAPPRLTVTSSGRTSPLEPPSRGGFAHPFASAPELPDVIPSPFMDPLESYFADMPTGSSSRISIHSDASTSQLSVPTTPVHKLATNPVQTGGSSRSPSPSPRKPRPRKVPPAVVTSHPRLIPTRSNTLTVPVDDPPPTPSSPSFLLGLAWPRPPLRQVYIDSRKPSASWHAVSRTIDERLIDGTGMINTDPCHVIMLAHAGLGTGITESLAHPGKGGGRRRSGTVMRDQQPLTPTAVSALASFAVRTAPLVST
ncbi:unnamed protein product [Rhizoctonia solani]|uniref:Uncharacterized protein n=1 Tax=Rhizoctonia solani TaxID=456999 RepID=A0A8H3A7N3_9AGAM|nr:unnamed protein product [Rhizoctonia solani]